MFVKLLSKINPKLLAAFIIQACNTENMIITQKIGNKIKHMLIFVSEDKKNFILILSYSFFSCSSVYHNEVFSICTLQMTAPFHFTLSRKVQSHCPQVSFLFVVDITSI